MERTDLDLTTEIDKTVGHLQLSMSYLASKHGLKTCNELCHAVSR